MQHNPASDLLKTALLTIDHTRATVARADLSAHNIEATRERMEKLRGAAGFLLELADQVEAALPTKKPHLKVVK